MVEVIHAATNNGLDDAYYAPFVEAIAALLTAGAADGSLKAGLDPEDVLLQLSVLWGIDPAREGEARTERILGLIVDGLRAQLLPSRDRGPARGQAPRTSSIATGRCSCSDSVQASAIQPASRASATVQGEGRVPATTSVNAVSSAR